MKFSVGLVCAIVVVIAMTSVHETEATKKLALLKAKFALKALPAVAAKAVVAKEVKTKTKIAFLKTLDAIKAKKIAALAVIASPISFLKKKFAFKVAEAKILKAIALHKLVGAAKILKNLKKGPIILPVPVAVPAKELKAAKLKAALKGKLPFAAAASLFPAASHAVNTYVPAPEDSNFARNAQNTQQEQQDSYDADAALEPEATEFITSFLRPNSDALSSLNPLPEFLLNARNVIQNAGANIPFLSALTGGRFSAPEAAEEEEEAVVQSEPSYRFVPELGFSNYNEVAYNPKVEVEVPTPYTGYTNSNSGY